MSAPYSSKAVANKFIDIAARTGEKLTPMQIQKLVYFAQGWYLANFRQELIEEDIQAWKFGPVIPVLYHEFKSYGNDQVYGKATEYDFVDSGGLYEITPEIDLSDSNTSNVIEGVWGVYGKYSGIQLSNMTHEQGTPWDVVIQQGGGAMSENKNIPNTLIQSYFEELMGKG